MPISFAEAIPLKNVASFYVSPFPANVRRVTIEVSIPPKALTMPPKRQNVVPAFANNNPQEKRPGGVLPISIDPKTNEVSVLFGYEQGNVVGFTDFGGASDSTDISREHTAVREFNEETCLAFWPDVSGQKINLGTTSGAQIEKKAKEPRTTNVYPLLYSTANKYYTCLAPVAYQSVSQIQSKIATVRRKVNSAPFFEKGDFVWISLKELIDWIEKERGNPGIPGKPGKSINWRFFGGQLKNFTTLKNGHKGEKKIYEDVMKYLKEIISLNK
jgi:hypothetical protein